MRRKVAEVRTVQAHRNTTCVAAATHSKWIHSSELLREWIEFICLEGTILWSFKFTRSFLFFLFALLERRNSSDPKYSIRCCYISALVLTCFRLTKGRATFFRPETIVAGFLHLMVFLFKVLSNHSSKRQFLLLHCRKLNKVTM